MIKTIAVLGANGNMGSKMSAIFACFGNAEVYMIGRSTVSLKKAMIDAKLSIRSDIIEKHLHILTYEDANDVIGRSDLIFESVAENMEIKKDIYELIKSSINDNAIIATGTSGLSINELSKNFDNEQRKRFLGLHFFNPPYSMTLCEIIPSKYTDKTLIKELKEYLINVLYRSIVISNDRPGFIANRIGFQFINMAMQYAERYKDKGGISYVDSIIGPFTGRNMAPLLTADFVGLDIHKSIVDNIYINSNDCFHADFRVTNYIKELVKSNKLGKKSGEGLYKSYVDENGIKHNLVYDINNNKYIEKTDYKFSFSNKIINAVKFGKYDMFKEVLYEDNTLESNICLEMLVKYIIYSIIIGYKIGSKVETADDAMASGFNWIPPMALIECLGGKKHFFNEVKKRNYTFMQNIDIDELIKICPEKSKYDYRKYIKAR